MLDQSKILHDKKKLKSSVISPKGKKQITKKYQKNIKIK